MKKTIWIIGCYGGIGKEISAHIRKKYDNVCLFDIVSPEQPKLSDKEAFFQADFSQRISVKEKCQLAAKSYGAPTDLVIAAGRVLSLDFDNTTDENIESLFNNNYMVVFNSLRFFFKYCNKSNDIEKSIVIISSNAGNASRPNQIVYASIKAAINSLVRSLAKDWGKYNIRINAIAPGTIIVPRNHESLIAKYPDFPNDYGRPLGKIMKPSNILPSCLFLLKSDNPITGQIITVDGGSSL